MSIEFEDIHETFDPILYECSRLGPAPGWVIITTLPLLFVSENQSKLLHCMHIDYWMHVEPQDLKI